MKVLAGFFLLLTVLCILITIGQMYIQRKKNEIFLKYFPESFWKDINNILGVDVRSFMGLSRALADYNVSSDVQENLQQAKQIIDEIREMAYSSRFITKSDLKKMEKKLGIKKKQVGFSVGEAGMIFD